MTAIEVHERYLLLIVLAEIETFAELPDWYLDMRESYVVAMVEVGVPFAPARWHGERLSSARRMAFSRAARRLASAGHIRRLTEPCRDRVRYIVPTRIGLRRALELVGDNADRLAIREGLLRTCWGGELAKQMGAEP